MWLVLGKLLDRLFDKPIEAGFLFLCGAALLVAAGIYGVRFIRSVRGKNGNGDEPDEYSKDLQGLGLPRTPRQRGEPFVAAGDGTVPAGTMRLVTAEVLDATVAGINRDINRVSGEATALLERVVKVEQTCMRTEADVKALPETFKELLAAQTVQLQESNRRHMLQAFEAMGKETDEKIAAALKRANGS